MLQSVSVGSTLSPRSQLSRNPGKRYPMRLRMAGPEDVLLLIEVSGTTLRRDREIKLPQYVRAGIPEGWILDLAGVAIERHNDPAEDGYRRTQRAQRGETLASEIFLVDG
jgi:Uma2 family endonuclease